MTNLASILTDSAERDAEHVAIKLDDAVLTYAALDGASAHVAGLLAEHGVGPGDRVGIMLPNVPYFPVFYYGVLRAGAVVVPMNVLLKRREVAFYLNDSGAKLLFAWHGFAEDAESGAEEAGAECIIVTPGEFEHTVGAATPNTEVVERDDADTAVILYTSGTTGTPKGAELTHHNLRRNAEVSRDLFSAGAEAVTLGALPLFHSFGQTCSMNAIVLAGGTLTMIPRFDPAKALEIIERDHVNIFMGVPTMYGALLHLRDRERYDTSTPEAVRVRRLGAARRAAAQLRAGIRLQDPRGIRTLGDLAGRVVQPPGPRAQARLDRDPGRRRGDEGRRRRTTTRSRRVRSARS